MPEVAGSLFISLFGFWMLAAVANAQSGKPEGAAQGSRVEIGGSVGWTSFVDEGPQDHFPAGASARIRIVRGLAFAPELTYMCRSRQDRDFVLLPNVAYEFRRWKKAVPSVIGGKGILYHRESRDRYEVRGSKAYASGGLGLKVFLKERFFISPELRAGRYPHLRMTATLRYMPVK